MAKHMEEVEKKKIINKKLFLAIILFIIIIMIPIILEEKIVQNHNEKTTHNNELVKEIQEELQTNTVLEKEYDIKDFQNYSFSNAQIKIENNISYINIDAKNNNSEKSQKQNVKIVLSGGTKKVVLEYVLPEIEANEIYNMKLNVINDLSNIEQIEIKETTSSE